MILGDYDRSEEEGSEQIISASLIIPHPQYNTYTDENDVMLIKLAVSLFRFLLIESSN